MSQVLEKWSSKQLTVKKGDLFEKNKFVFPQNTFK